MALKLQRGGRPNVQTFCAVFCSKKTESGEKTIFPTQMFPEVEIFLMIFVTR